MLHIYRYGAGSVLEGFMHPKIMEGLWSLERDLAGHGYGDALGGGGRGTINTVAVYQLE